MTDDPDSLLQCHLTLDNVGKCTLRALDDDARYMVKILSKIMHMQSLASDSDRFVYSHEKLFDVQVDGSLNTPIPVKPPLVSFKPIEGQNRDLVTAKGVSDPDVQIAELSIMASGMARHFESLGGGLVHGALIVRRGYGIILAGPSQIGKTTSCNCLPDGWHALSDDATLIVPTSQDTYAAHPWPTWSRLMYNGPGGSWDVAKGVPLQSIFFLKHGEVDRAQRIGTGEASCMLFNATQQISQIHLPEISPDNCLRDIHTMQFDNVCAIARKVNNWHLTISPKGQFHNEIDQALDVSLMEAVTQ